MLAGSFALTALRHVFCSSPRIVITVDVDALTDSNTAFRKKCPRCLRLAESCAPGPVHFGPSKPAECQLRVTAACARRYVCASGNKASRPPSLASQTPRSVTKAVISRAGVTSNAGFLTATDGGAIANSWTSSP